MLAHGGNLIQASQQFNIPIEDWIDLSTGINPNAYPIPAIDGRAWHHLPQENDGLEDAAIQYYGTPNLLALSGSQAAIQTLPTLRRPSNVLMPDIMYQEHAEAWQRAGHNLHLFSDEPTRHQLQHVDVLVLCNPNNPTAKVYTVEQLLAWHHQLQKKQGWLIVDEAFIDATPECSLSQFGGQDGLFILRSLGKFFGLAGARVGFLIGPPSWLAHIRDKLGPWTIAGPSRAIAKQALLDASWQNQARTQLLAAQLEMRSVIESLGLTIAGSTAFFHYVSTPYSKRLHTQLAEKGIWVRHFNNPLALRFGLANRESLLTLKSKLKHFQMGII